MKDGQDRERDAPAAGDDGDRQPITVVIIAASATVRAGLAALIGADERFTVTDSQVNATSASRATEAPPQAVIVELDEAAEAQLHDLTAAEPAGTPSPALVVLAADVRVERVADLLRSGARAVLPRAATGEEIIAALAAAVAGLVVIHPDVLATPEAARVLLETEDAAERSAGAPEAVMIEPLTPREREILNLLAEGLGNKEIAGRLHISEHTVKFHVSSVFAKLGVASRTEAVTEGLRRGLILL